MVAVVGGVSCVCCSFFFFQAEDGIRDTSVTGVQTCALPIFVTMTPGHEILVGGSPRGAGSRDPASSSRADRRPAPPRAEPTLQQTVARCRSEERRVGKEWRSRRAPYT